MSRSSDCKDRKKTPNSQTFQRKIWKSFENGKENDGSHVVFCCFIRKKPLTELRNFGTSELSLQNKPVGFLHHTHVEAVVLRVSCLASSEAGLLLMLHLSSFFIIFRFTKVLKFRSSEVPLRGFFLIKIKEENL